MVLTKKIIKDVGSEALLRLASYKFRDGVFVLGLLLVLYFTGFITSREFEQLDCSVFSVIGFKTFVIYVYEYLQLLLVNVMTWGKLLHSYLYLAFAVTAMFFFLHMDTDFVMRIKGRKQWTRVVVLTLASVIAYDIFVSL